MCEQFEPVQFWTFWRTGKICFSNIFVSKNDTNYYIHICLYQKNNTNKYPNIFVSKKLYKYDTNEYLYRKTANLLLSTCQLSHHLRKLVCFSQKTIGNKEDKSLHYFHFPPAQDRAQRWWEKVQVPLLWDQVTFPFWWKAKGGVQK